MPAATEKSQLKRGRVRLSRSCYVRHQITNARLQQSQGEQLDPKKPRRSERHQSPEGHLKNGQLPTPLTAKASDEPRGGTMTPPSQIKSGNDIAEATRSPNGPSGISSPPTDTQPFSQFVYPPGGRSYAVEDEEGEGVWGYLVPVDDHSGEILVLRRRSMCPVPASKVGKASGEETVPAGEYKKQEVEYEKEKAVAGVNTGGYLIGRHPECGKSEHWIYYTCSY